MKIVSIPIEVMPKQIENFPAEAKRMSEDKGAMHIRPGQTITMTDDELAHVLLQYKGSEHRFVVNAVPSVVKDDGDPVSEEVPDGNDGSNVGGEDITRVDVGPSATLYSNQGAKKGKNRK